MPTKPTKPTQPTNDELTRPTDDELDAALGGGADPFADDDLDAALTSAAEEMDLGDYSEEALAQAVVMDWRLLTAGNWYLARVASNTSKPSGRGNPQFVTVLQVVAPLTKPDEVDAQGNSLAGVTVLDYIPTPHPPFTPDKVQQMGKVKKYATICGLAELNKDGSFKKIKPGTKAASFVGKLVAFRAVVDTEFNPSEPRNKVGDVAAPPASLPTA